MDILQCKIDILQELYPDRKVYDNSELLYDQYIQEIIERKHLNDFKLMYMAFLYKVEYLHTNILNDESKYGLTLLELDTFTEENAYDRIALLTHELRQNFVIRRCSIKNTGGLKVFDDIISNIDDDIKNIVLNNKLYICK